MSEILKPEPWANTTTAKMKQSQTFNGFVLLSMIIWRNKNVKRRTESKTAI